MSDADALEAADTLIAEQLAGLAYEELPQWSPEQLASIDPIQELEETDADFAERDTLSDALLEAKMQAEDEVAFANTTIRAMRRLNVSLLMRRDSDESDQAVITFLQSRLEDKDLAYSDVLTAIRAVDTAMTEERAAWFYEQLKTLWPEKPRAKDAFTDFTTLVTHSLKNPTFATQNVKPATALLRTINHLAARAKKPPLRIK